MADEYVSIDSRAFDWCRQMKDTYIQRYADIATTYDAIVKDLSDNWKGESAELFLDDAEVIRKNIGGIADVLSAMCSTLDDIQAQLQKTDQSMAEVARELTADAGGNSGTSI